jgi:peroxiredoxin
MALLRQDFVEFDKRDTAILVIGTENASAFARYFKEHDLPFIGLPDPEHSELKLYGQEVNLFKPGYMPAQVLVDKHGMARHVCYGHDI